MTAVLVVSVYLVALAFFLGLDILSKVPPTLYAIVLAGLGALGAVAAVGAFPLWAADAPPLARTFGMMAAAFGGAAAGGGLIAVGQLARAFARGAAARAGQASGKSAGRP